MEYPSLKHKRRWLIIKVKMLSPIYAAELLSDVWILIRRPLISPPVHSVLESHTELPSRSRGPPCGIWKHSSRWSLLCVALQHSVVLGTWYSEGKRKRKKSMAFEAGTIYVLFIYSKSFIWCHSQNEKLWLRASYIGRDTFWWDEKRLFSQGRKIKRNLWLNFRDFLHRKNRSITFSSR